MIALIDDHVLGALLRGRRVRTIERATSVFTTGLWYLRLCRALQTRPIEGRLSQPFATLPDRERQAAIASALRLPSKIGLLSLRELAPPVASILDTHPGLNLLAQEVLTAARSLDAWVVTAPGNLGPKLAAALSTEGIPTRTASLR